MLGCGRAQGQCWVLTSHGVGALGAPGQRCVRSYCEVQGARSGRGAREVGAGARSGCGREKWARGRDGSTRKGLFPGRACPEVSTSLPPSWACFRDTRGLASGPRWRPGLCASARSRPGPCGSPGDRSARGSCTRRAEREAGGGGGGGGLTWPRGTSGWGAAWGPSSLAGRVWDRCAQSCLGPTRPLPRRPTCSRCEEPGGRRQDGTCWAVVCSAPGARPAGSGSFEQTWGTLLVTCTAPPGRGGVASSPGLPVYEGSGGHSG